MGLKWMMNGWLKGIEEGGGRGEARRGNFPPPMCALFVYLWNGLTDPN
jgi:hypothetical protein